MQKPSVASTATCEPFEIATWKGLKFRRGHKDPPNRASQVGFVFLGLSKLLTMGKLDRNVLIQP